MSDVVKARIAAGAESNRGRMPVSQVSHRLASGAGNVTQLLKKSK